MTPAYTLSSRAERDIDEIAEYLSRESLAAALRFYDQVPATLHKLASAPGMGRPVSLDTPSLTGLRLWRIDGFHAVLVFYMPAEHGVRVIRVLHASRDADTALAKA